MTVSSACAPLCWANGKLDVVKWFLPQWGMSRRRKSFSTDSQESVAPHWAFAAKSKGASAHQGVGCPIGWQLLQLCSGEGRLCSKMEQEQRATEGSSAACSNLLRCQGAGGRCHICSCFWGMIISEAFPKKILRFLGFVLAQLLLKGKMRNKQNSFSESPSANHGAVRCFSCRGSRFWWWSGSIYWMAAIKFVFFFPTSSAPVLSVPTCLREKAIRLLEIPVPHYKAFSENKQHLLESKPPQRSCNGERHSQSRGSSVCSERCPGGEPQCGGTVLGTWTETGTRVCRGITNIELSLHLY